MHALGSCINVRKWNWITMTTKIVVISIQMDFCNWIGWLSLRLFFIGYRSCKTIKLNFRNRRAVERKCAFYNCKLGWYWISSESKKSFSWRISLSSSLLFILPCLHESSCSGTTLFSSQDKCITVFGHFCILIGS